MDIPKQLPSMLVTCNCCSKYLKVDFFFVFVFVFYFLFLLFLCFVCKGDTGTGGGVTQRRGLRNHQWSGGRVL